LKSTEAKKRGIDIDIRTASATSTSGVFAAENSTDCPVERSVEKTCRSRILPLEDPGKSPAGSGLVADHAPHEVQHVVSPIPAEALEKAEEAGGAAILETLEIEVEDELLDLVGCIPQCDQGRRDRSGRGSGDRSQPVENPCSSSALNAPHRRFP